MPASEFNIESFLDDSLPDTGISSADEVSESTVSWCEPEYKGEIDYRIRQLSYSSLLTLHSCPRKFQLYRLRTTHRTEESQQSTITFAFGHVVGEAIQLALEGATEQDIIFKMFQGWHTDLLAEDTKLNKSFFQAVIAIQRFLALRNAGFLKEYELVYYNGKPACELSFAINFPDGFRLRGFVDAVLRHKLTGKVVVLECKTTGSAFVNPATYKNSSQAIGYSIVLDTIFPDLSSYEVLYLIYSTKSGEYLPIPFQKTYLQRALWIRELLLDIETIKMYEEAGVYPMHGESCYSFFRECEYLNVCQLSTEYLTKSCTPEEEDKTEYQITLTLDDLLTTQLAKAEA
jgi:PD-(D/E)XK nuclease superfamily